MEFGIGKLKFLCNLKGSLNELKSQTHLWLLRVIRLNIESYDLSFNDKLLKVAFIKNLNC